MPSENVRPRFHVRVSAEDPGGPTQRLRLDIEENLNRIYQSANQTTGTQLAQPALRATTKELEELRRATEHQLEHIVRLINERREKGTQVRFIPPSLHLIDTEQEPLRHAVEVELGYLCRQLGDLTHNAAT